MIQFQESFRLHADMAEFLRQEIYRHDGIHFHSRRDTVLAPVSHIDPFVAAALDPDHPLVVIVHDESSSQLRNDFEQALIAPVLKALAESPYELEAREGLGVVVPHRAQRAALQDGVACLVQRDATTGTIKLSAVDTVERFQGDERDVIVYSATESDPQYLLSASKFLMDPRRLTVALSRAKQKMIVVASRSVFSIFSADEETFQNAQLWKNLLNRTCTELLWEDTKQFNGMAHNVQVWGNCLTPVVGQRPPSPDGIEWGTMRATRYSLLATRRS
jgi:superfamily I DNA and/or RNA helicase